MLRQRHAPDPVPQRLGDDRPAARALRRRRRGTSAPRAAARGGSASKRVDQRAPAHRRRRRRAAPGTIMPCTIRDGVAEPEALRDALEPLVERVDSRPACRLRANGDDRDGRCTPAPAVGLLGLELLLVLGERDDGGERGDRDRDADQAEQHPQLVHADLRPGVGERAEEPAHAARPSGGAGTAPTASTPRRRG